MSRFTITAPATGEHGTLIEAGPGTDILKVPAREIVGRFKSTGIVLFRGFDLDLGMFQTLTEKVSAGFISYDGGAAAREYVNGDPTVMTVSEPTHSYPVPLHGEMYYVERKPLILWFYCVKPVKAGGETTVGDGTWILKNLSDRTRGLFEENRIKYVMIFPEGRWQKIFHTEDIEEVRRHCERNDYRMHIDAKDGSVVAEYVSDAIWKTRFGEERSFINNVFAITRWEWAGVPYRKVRLEDGRRIPEEIIQELWEIEARATREVAWKPGDVLMVDNTRFLHGRRRFEDMTREIYVRLATEMVS